MQTPGPVEIADIAGLKRSLAVRFTPVPGADHRPIHRDGLNGTLGAGRQINTIER